MPSDSSQSSLNHHAELADSKQLTTIYKKNGAFDKRRRHLLENFKVSETCENLLLKLRIMIESKVKNDPQILMKNKGKMAALIQGEIVNRGGKQSNEQENDASAKIEENNSILSIVDRDIQEKILDSSEFHELLKDELKDIKRKLLGISDEDYAKLRADERTKREKQQKEELARKLRIERERKELETRKLYQGMSLKSGGGSSYRVDKPSGLHSRNGGDKQAAKDSDKKKKVEKVQVMRY
ncbi:uncharacterized protein LODBEIA_P24500 [Lodderomyces beijingensis]|uniref:BOD1/SHG1 domain-containing protein n=1 Tax=Lodderomyces beijingensis TaxID=1775926 RepID=A0ABP0ZM87_9ASCO